MELRQKAYYAARDAGATDLIDVVVPRGEIPKFMEEIDAISRKYATIITGAGHAGDGNIHLAILEPDHDKLSMIAGELYQVGKSLGGAISAEHGIGCARKKYFMEVEDQKR